MPADAWLGALAYFNLNRRASLQIFRRHAKATRSHLDNGPIRIRIQLLMQAALACVEKGAGGLGGPRERQTCIQADGAVRHGREHHGQLQFQLRPNLRAQMARLIKFQHFWLGAQISPQLHRLAQGIYGRISHLGGVQ